MARLPRAPRPKPSAEDAAATPGQLLPPDYLDAAKEDVGELVCLIENFQRVREAALAKVLAEQLKKPSLELIARKGYSAPKGFEVASVELDFSGSTPRLKINRRKS